MVRLIDKLPPPMNRYAHDLLDKAPVEPKELDNAVREKVSAQQDKAGEYIQQALGITFTFAVQTALLVIALYFLLIDGVQLVAWCEDASPLREGQTTELLHEFKSVSVSVIVSSLATGVIQSVVALIGYLIAGVPKPWFFAVVTFFMSFVPAIGAGGTSFVATLILLAGGAVAAQRDRLPTVGCGRDEVCAPCYDPITGENTGACGVNGDRPQKPRYQFPRCCDNGRGTDVGVCVPPALAGDQAGMLRQDTCASGRLCAPIARAVDPDAKFRRCFGLGAGGCVPKCIVDPLEAALLSRVTCDVGEVCAPCALFAIFPTGACD